jgi:hypothetical protein
MHQRSHRSDQKYSGVNQSFVILYVTLTQLKIEGLNSIARFNTKLVCSYSLILPNGNFPFYQSQVQ